MSVDRSLEAGVLRLTMNRPEARNALDEASYRALSAALAEADGDAAVGAVVLTGAGGHFTAGNDLRDFQAAAQRRPPGGAAEEPAGVRWLKALVAFEKPLLAAVEGVAVGIGTTTLLHCDLAFAGAGARFRMPFVPLGLCPEGGSSWLLPRAAGPKRAADLLLTGREFGAAEAEAAGLLTGVVPDGGALARATEAAGQLAALPPAAVRAGKALLRRAERGPVLEAIGAEMVEFRRLLGSPEAQAAFAAFFARRS
ncbi:MAG TPA: enoyl-CoA hydratase-related protein [Anaeromyxobacteraceae bacterium]